MDLKGKRIGPYTLVSQIGKGGAAEVWLAHQDALNREVAIKVIDSLPRDAVNDSIERLTREARFIAQFDYPGILPVIDYGSTDRFVYLVMPHVRGGNLAKILKQGP